MEDNISASIAKIMKDLLKRFAQAPNPKSPNVIPTLLNSRYDIARQRVIQQIRQREDRQEINCRHRTTVGSKNWRKENGTLRLVFKNINGFGLDKELIKDKKVYVFLKDEEVNMMEFSENNICWSKTDPKNRLWDRTRGLFESSHLNCDNNELEPHLSTMDQPGGVAVINID